jgi:hypothetical protein
MEQASRTIKGQHVCILKPSPEDWPSQGDGFRLRGDLLCSTASRPFEAFQMFILLSEQK